MRCFTLTLPMCVRISCFAGGGVSGAGGINRNSGMNDFMPGSFTDCGSIGFNGFSEVPETEGLDFLSDLLNSAKDAISPT